MRQNGFTLIELMIAMVVGLTAVSAVYALGSAMTEQFFVEQRVASSQSTSRVATLELRRDISRAGLFGTPNGSLREGDVGVERFEPTCDANRPELPQLSGSPLPMGAFQHYANQDIAVLDPDSVNAGARADRLRVLTSMYLTEQLLVNSTSIDGLTLVLQDGNQAYRRTFAWGNTAGPFASGVALDYRQGTLDWDSAWGGEAASWKGIGMRGARAFQSGSVLHIETPEGRHFFRAVYGKSSNVQNQIRLTIDPKLPIGTACLPGAAEGSTIAPLQWVEYAIIDPFAPPNASAATDLLELDGVFNKDLANPSSPVHQFVTLSPSELLGEEPNRVLVRRILNASDGSVKENSTQIVAEFVTHFEVGFMIDNNSGSTTLPPDVVYDDGSAVNDNPERVRSVIIDLGIRSPLEDPALEYNGDVDAGVVPTRFEVDKDAKGSARVRHLRIEIPVMNLARKNLG